jgi:hypothetical protein
LIKQAMKIRAAAGLSWARMNFSREIGRNTVARFASQ